MPTPLPVLDSCAGCGACCLVVTLPPFRRDLDDAGEDAWERLRWDHPDLRASLLAADRARLERAAPAYGTPCLWYDPQTRRCQHHDLRPRACRDFALNGNDCHDARRRARIS